jgi:hypothetical protein
MIKGFIIKPLEIKWPDLEMIAMPLPWLAVQFEHAHAIW